MASSYRETYWCVCGANQHHATLWFDGWEDEDSTGPISNEDFAECELSIGSYAPTVRGRLQDCWRYLRNDNQRLVDASVTLEYADLKRMHTRLGEILARIESKTEEH